MYYTRMALILRIRPDIQEGTSLHVAEGKMTIKAIGFTENGTPSDQVSADYTVIIPTPAAPKANYASGKYKKAPKVSLRPGDEDDKECIADCRDLLYHRRSAGYDGIDPV